MDSDGLAPSLVPLPGGHSGETFGAEVAGERTVVRVYAARGATRGANAAEIDAAVLRLVRGLVPVPEVLEVRRAQPSSGTPALLVTSWLPGRRLDEVLPDADDELLGAIGRDVGAVLARLAQMPMMRPGEFLDGELRIGPWPSELDDLAAWVARCTGSEAFADWSPSDRAALVRLADEAQELIDRTDRVCLVHSDFNPKNLLVDPASGRVTGVVDWEFAHAGSPFEDLGNFLRFDPPSVLANAVRSTYTELVVDAPHDPAELTERARAADMFALVELASRAGENPVADQAQRRLRAMVRSGLDGRHPGRVS